ncbi:DUF4376 domain-containing protein [Pseudomonas luteola]|uniref:DUF4376 domain-containing protein n=1 Tax=Pseudomonas luteola TaxID=47886 RepID=UPI003A886BD2
MVSNDRAVIVVDGIVTNVVVSEPAFAAEMGWIMEDEAQIGWTYDGETFTPPQPEVYQPTSSEIDAERDRRIDSGIEFNGVMYQTRVGDRENIAGMAQLAFMAIQEGAQEGELRWANPDEDFAWIAEDNSLVPMDAPTVVAFGKEAAARKLQLIKAARALKDMDPIPADYTDDKWWP